MRAIDILKVKTAITNAWQQKADAKTVELKKEYDRINQQYAGDRKAWKKALSEVVKQMQEVWQDNGLKQLFMEASFGKCWYCEANVAELADNAIDHFRPKNRVFEDKTHPGYWWLACDWHNYRFACTFCNSTRNTEDSTGGKQDHFPLRDEQKRVREPDSSLIDEEPLFLDPLCPEDMPYLTFDLTGSAAPRYSKEEDEEEYRRAAESIHWYHLDRPKLNMKRGKLMASMGEKLSAAEEFYRVYWASERTNPTAKAAYQQAVATLVEYLRPEAEFSAAARAFLAIRRGTSPVARHVMDIAL